MSLIHEALEKIEQDKGGKLGERLRPLLKREEPKGKERSENLWAVYGIAGFLLLSLVIGLVYFFTNPPARKNESRFRRNSSVKRVLPASPLFHPVGYDQFVLTGITQAGNEWTAIVNNQIVRVGDEIDSARVQAIDEERVILNLEGQAIHLNLYGKEGNHLTRLAPPLKQG